MLYNGSMPPPFIVKFGENVYGDFVETYEKLGYSLEWFGEYLGDFYEYVKQVSNDSDKYKLVFAGILEPVLFRIFELVMRDRNLIERGVDGRIYDFTVNMTNLLLNKETNRKKEYASKERIKWSLAEDFVIILHVATLVDTE